jgi:hypothetical protein
MFSFGTAGLGYSLMPPSEELHLRDGYYSVGDAITGEGLILTTPGHT